MNKPIIGILPTPYFDNNEIKNMIFLSNYIINLIRKNKIEIIIIPYNVPEKKLKLLIKNIDGFIFPGSQIGNYYHTKEFKQHYNKQKFIIKIIELINKKERILPIFLICHGFQNYILSKSKIPINKLFIDLHAFKNYKRDPLFTKDGYKLEKLYNKSYKLIHNNKLGIHPRIIKKTKKIQLIAKNKDKNNKEFVEIIKHKNLPFYGFQAHPEINNPKLFNPFFKQVRKSFYERCNNSKKKCILKNTKKYTFKSAKKYTLKVKNYNKIIKNKNSKWFIYKI